VSEATITDDLESGLLDDLTPQLGVARVIVVSSTAKWPANRPLTRCLDSYGDILVEEKQPTLAEMMTTAQLEKLTLEIRAMKDKGNWQDTFSRFSPLISVLIAVGGFLFGVFQYYKEQEKAQVNEETDQRIKIQAQIHNDIDQILKFPKENGQGVSQISYLLEDIDQSIRIGAGKAEQKAEGVQREQRKNTIILYEFVVGDCDFNKQKDVKAALSILDHWSDYADYVRADNKRAREILIKYADALFDLRKKHPCYVTQVKYADDVGEEFDEPEDCPDSDQPPLRHLEDLIIGFRRHLGLLKQDTDRSNFIKDFQASTCNQTLTRQEFHMSFDPNEYPETFRDCYADQKKK